MTLSGRSKAALVLAGGVVLPGIANYLLGEWGYSTLGSAVWATGYVGAVLLVWYVWLRPMELTGPSGQS